MSISARSDSTRVFVCASVDPHPCIIVLNTSRRCGLFTRDQSFSHSTWRGCAGSPLPPPLPAQPAVLPWTDPHPCDWPATTYSYHHSQKLAGNMAANCHATMEKIILCRDVNMINSKRYFQLGDPGAQLQIFSDFNSRPAGLPSNANSWEGCFFLNSIYCSNS